MCKIAMTQMYSYTNFSKIKLQKRYCQTKNILVFESVNQNLVYIYLV